jgi:hypothetical protein
MGLNLTLAFSVTPWNDGASPEKNQHGTTAKATDTPMRQSKTEKSWSKRSPRLGI